MRIVSLLPAATEIVAALGLTDALVGVSHECDFPPEVATKPRVTRSPIHSGLPSAEIDARVKASLDETGELYTLDEALLQRLRPDVLLTQGLCDVCAPTLASVSAVAARLPGPPRVVDLDPRSLADILADVRTTGAALGVAERAASVVADLDARIAAVRAGVAGAPRPRCVLLEWIDPPYRGGHWDPELVEIAGGIDPVGRAGEDSTAVRWEEIVAAAPEVLVLACCGCDVARTRQDLPTLRAQPGWSTLPAVQSGRVYAVDGTAYFSRPGPRVVDSLEILAELIHPERFAGRFPDRGVVRVEP